MFRLWAADGVQGVLEQIEQAAAAERKAAEKPAAETSAEKGAEKAAEMEVPEGPEMG